MSFGLGSCNPGGVGAYPTAIHGPVATSWGRQKHLNLLLHDRAVENAATYGWNTQLLGSNTGSYKSMKTRNTYQGEDLTQTAIDQINAVRGPHMAERSSEAAAPLELCPPTVSFAAGSSTGTLRTGPAPWLMPWQTGDRTKGGEVAKSMRNKRSPIGAFTNNDLAKASK